MPAPPNTISPISTVVAAAGNRRAAINRRYQNVLIFLFLTALVLPVIGTFANWDIQHGFNEKRRLAAFPEWPRNLSQFPAFLEGALSDYRDHFGFRRSLIQGLMLTEVGERQL